MENRKEYMPLVSDCILNLLNSYNSGITKDQFYSMNILDTTGVSEFDMGAVNSDVIQFCKENGCYAALPPFEEGAFIDRSERRYTHWKVLEVSDDYFRIEFNHYPIIFIDGDYNEKISQGRSAELVHLCWYLSCKVVVKVKVLTPEEHVKMLSRHPDFKYFDSKLIEDQNLIQRLSDTIKAECHVGGVVESYEHYMPHDLKKLVKKGKYYTSDGKFVNSSWVKEVVADTLELGTKAGVDSMLFCSTGPIIEMLVYVNYMLSQKSTSTSTSRHITSVYVPNAETPETRKERHFGKINVISEKKPRSINKENIQRVYTAISWQRRSHLRHLPSGKVVPVKSAICKRHNAEDVSVPQVVYRA